jgi:polysaccharide export outer membrane protein
MNTLVRTKRILLVFALGLAALTAIAATARAQSPVAGDAGLQPGDVVQITVWQRDELSGEFTVAPDGSLSHPLYRQVRVTGMPATQVEDRIRSFLSAYEANPQLVVQPMYKVVVSGAVMRPEIYNLPPGTTVTQAVTRAGGVTANGKRDEVRMIRNSNELELDLAEAETIRMPVQSGDEIFVEGEEAGGGFRATVLPIVQMALLISNLVYSVVNR